MEFQAMLVWAKLFLQGGRGTLPALERDRKS